MSPISSEVTDLLDRWSGGDENALDELVPLVFDDVREIARQHLSREGPGHTLQPTALVGEVYLRLEKRRTVTWKNREQFFGFLAQLIRRILVDHARTRRRAKRGSGERPISLDDVFGLTEVRHPELVALDDALGDLAKIDGRQSQVVELHYFMGLSLKQIAEVVGLSLSTVNREWKTARMWLLRELSQEPSQT